MYLEKRPTCVTVIGWAWIIIGGLMILSGIMVFFLSVMICKMEEEAPDMPLFFKIFPLLVVLQLVVGVIGLISGINFLKLKSWSRSVLEILSWLLLLYTVGFGIIWTFEWISMSSEHGIGGIDIMGAVMGVMVTAFYGVPLAIMVKYLRGGKVRSAMK